MQSEKIKEIYVEDGAIMTSTTMVGDFQWCMWSEIAGSLIKQLCVIRMDCVQPFYCIISGITLKGETIPGHVCVCGGTVLL